MPWDPSLRPYLLASKAAFLNAEQLERDAALLFARKRYPRAFALAVTGMEELGKAGLLWFVGLGRVPEAQRARVLKAVKRKHPTKQAAAIPFALTGELISLARRTPFRFPRRKLRGWDELASWLVAMAPRIRRHAERMLQPLLGDLAAIEAGVNAVGAGELEMRRQRALYTDLNGTAILEPSAIKRREAAATLAQLRSTLRAQRHTVRVADYDEKGINAVLVSIDLQRRLWEAGAS